MSAKKEKTLKKPAVKKSPAKTVAPKTSATKPAAKKESTKKTESATAKSVKKAPKPITVVKKAPKPPLKKPEEPTEFENQSQSFAFSFAEQMKKRQRAQDESQQKASDASSIKLSRRPTSRGKGKELQFPAADLAEFRKRLILLRQEAMGQSATLKTIALEHTDDRGSEDDDGSDAFMRLQNLSQVDSQNKVIQKIDEALARIQDGTYGICEVCGQLIRKPRLLNLPFVHTCMECQSEMENPFGRH